MKENLEESKINKIFKLFKKVFLYGFFSLFIILISIIGIVIYYEDDIKSKAVQEINQYLNTPVYVLPQNIEITFLRTFPNITLQFTDLTVKGSHPKHSDTLLKAHQIQLHFSILSVLNKNYTIKKISADKILFQALRRKDGIENWNFLKSTSKSEASEASGILDIEDIEISNCKIIFKDTPNKTYTELFLEDVNTSLHSESIFMNISGKLKGTLISLNVDEKKLIHNKKLHLITDFKQTKSEYEIRNFKLQLQEMKLNAFGNITYDSTLRSAHIKFEGDRIRPEEILSLFNYRNQHLPSTNDPISVAGTYQLQNQKWELKMSAEGKNLKMTHSGWKTHLSDIQFKASLHAGTTVQGNFELNQISGKINEKKFDGNFHLQNFSNPDIHFNFKGYVPLPLLITLASADTLLGCQGDLYAECEASFNISQLDKKEKYPDTHFNFLLQSNGLELEYKPARKILRLDSIDIHCDPNQILINNVTLNMAPNIFKISGIWKQTLSYLAGKAPLEVEGKISTPSWNVKTWMNDIMEWSTIFKTHSTSDSSGALKGYRMEMEMYAETLEFDAFHARKARMHMDWRDHQVFAEEIFMECLGGLFEGAVRMDMEKNKYHFLSEGHFADIRLKEAFNAFHQFGQQTLTDKHLNGNISCSYVLQSDWNKNFDLIPSSLYCQSEYTLRNGRLFQFEPMKGLSAFMDVEELSDIRFEDITGSISVEKNKILIPKTQIRNSALNISLQGEHTFENVLDYRLSVLLSELLNSKSKKRNEFFSDEQNRRKAFVRIYGPFDHLKYSFDNQGWKEKIKEDFNQQKSDLKKIFQEEFGKKRDSSATKAKSRFEIEEPGKIKTGTPKNTKTNSKDEEEDY